MWQPIKTCLKQCEKCATFTINIWQTPGHISSTFWSWKTNNFRRDLHKKCQISGLLFTASELLTYCKISLIDQFMTMSCSTTIICCWMKRATSLGDDIHQRIHLSWKDFRRVTATAPISGILTSHSQKMADGLSPIKYTTRKQQDYIWWLKITFHMLCLPRVLSQPVNECHTIHVPTKVIQCWKFFASL